MKPAVKRVCLILVSWTLSTSGFSAETFSVTDDFIAYLKETTNPQEFGLKPDGRFYPYSSPRGRRIGYDHPVMDKGLYHRGCTKAEAETQLRAEAEKALTELTRYMAEAYSARPFDKLSRKSQEILLDFAFSEGARNIPAAFYETVVNEDWTRLFDSFMYIRWIEKGWPDTTKNKAFADRWLDPQLRLRPESAAKSLLHDHESFKIGDGFVAYIQAAANPDKHGLRADGRFYPYSSPQGRRIGYRQPIADKKLYREGWCAADADRALREQLQTVAAELRERLRREMNRDFGTLPRASREILLDFGFTEGVAKLQPAFIETAVRLDWKRILDPDFYARYEADWPDSVRNKAFYERWRNPESRQ